jgi:NitT/TauT family transport system permease protein
MRDELEVLPGSSRVDIPADETPEAAPVAIGAHDSKELNVDGAMVTPSYRTAIAKTRIHLWLPPLCAFLALAALWQIYAHGHPFVLPTIPDIWTSLKQNPSMYAKAMKTTLTEVAIGAGSGIIVALVIAIAMAEVRLIERALMPLMVTLMVTPMVAIAPALVIAFGFGPFPKYLVTGLVVVFPVLINSVAGLRNMDSRTLDVFTTVHASRWEIFRHLRWPGSLPFIFAGLRIAFPLSVVGATVAEIAAAGVASGLGSLVETASAASNVTVTWTAIFLLCVLGILMMALLMFIRRRVLWWDNETALAKRR